MKSVPHVIDAMLRPGHVPAGLLVSAAIYLLMMRSRRTRPAGAAPFRP